MRWYTSPMLRLLRRSALQPLQSVCAVILFVAYIARLFMLARPSDRRIVDAAHALNREGCWSLGTLRSARRQASCLPHLDAPTGTL